MVQLDKSLYKLKEAAQLLGESENTLATWTKRGTLAYVLEYEGKKKIKFIPASEIERLAVSRTDPYDELLAEWKAAEKAGLYRRKPIASGTLQDYTYGLQNFWKNLKKSPTIDLLTVNNLAQAIANVGIDHENENCHHSKKEKMYFGFLTFYRFLIRKGIKTKIGLLDIEDIKPLPYYPIKRKYIREDEVAELLEVNETITTGRHDVDFDKFLTKFIICLFTYSGVRRAEALRLPVSAINFQEKYIRVYGKGRKYRDVVLLPQLEMMILEWLEKHRPESEHPNLLLTKHGKPLTVRNLRRKLETVVKKTEVKASPHSFRYLFGSILGNNENVREGVKENEYCSPASQQATTRFYV